MKELIEVRKENEENERINCYSKEWERKREEKPTNKLKIKTKYKQKNRRRNYWNKTIKG